MSPTISWERQSGSLTKGAERMENLKKYIPNCAGKKILVFGDLMLDEHIWSRVARISPEAPVPIADVIKITHVPGGCGNVAANIAALGGIPCLVGVIGA